MVQLVFGSNHWYLAPTIISTWFNHWYLVFGSTIGILDVQPKLREHWFQHLVIATRIDAKGGVLGLF